MGCSPNHILFPDSDKPITQPLPSKKFTSESLTFQYPGYLYEKNLSNGSVLFTATNLNPEESLNNLSYYDLQELVIINVVKKIQTQKMDTDEFIKSSINEIKQLGKVEFITRDKILKDGIFVLEYILASPQIELHLKQYFYCYEGDSYVVTISTPAKNWSKINEVTDTLEKSLSFA